MKIIIAPDSFKGSLSSEEAAAAMVRGIMRVMPDVKLIRIPMADGGEGTVSAILCVTKGKKLSVPVCDPMMKLTNAVYGVLNDGSAIIEMAQASGITLIPQTERDPMEASTFGTGEMIIAAFEQGCRKIYIGIGGSATNDGGMGMAEALGVRFYDAHGHILTGKGRSLNQIHSIDVSNIDDRIRETEFIVMCDVRNPLCGPDGASVVFGPQKGASQEQIGILDAGLQNYAEKLEDCIGAHVIDVPGAGAAGGLGAGLMAFCNAKLVSGCNAILDICGFDRLLQDADLVITGEGRIDKSTGFGKVPHSIATRASKQGVPVVALGGGVCQLFTADENPLFIAESAVTDVMSLEYAIENSAQLLESATERVMRLINLGINLNKTSFNK
jgi:glycerate kinase